jgi:hypothetical protein
VPDDSDQNAAVAGKGAHLEAEHAVFFRHWEYLLNKEAQDTQVRTTLPLKRANCTIDSCN